MLVLVLLAYLCWVAGAVLAFESISDGSLISLFPAITVGVSGFAFIAFNQVIVLLTDLRDALAPEARERRSALKAQAQEEAVREGDAQEMAWKKLDGE